MTIYEKAVHELQRQGLASAYTHDNEVWVNAWVDDLECTISISVHDIQIMNLADDYDEHIEETNNIMTQFEDGLPNFLCGSCGELCSEYTYSEERDVDECNDCKLSNQNTITS